MKTTKILSVLLVLMISSQFTFAQDITADTTLANNYFEKAGIFQDSVQYDSAIVYYEKASVLYREHKQWRTYLLSETYRGDCYSKLWQNDKSIAILKPAILKALMHINEKDTIVANAYFILGIQYYYQSNNDSALLYFQKPLQIRKKILGESNMIVAHNYNAIGNVYAEKFEYDLAIEFYSRTLEIVLELFDEKHASIANTYYNIGRIYADKIEYDLALEYYFKALEINKDLFGEKDISVADIYKTIGQVYYSKNEYDLALQYNFNSLQMKIELLGEKHPSVALSYNNHGNIYSQICKYNLALDHYFKALNIQIGLLGEKHIDVAITYSNIGGVSSDKGEYDLALEYYSKALQIFKEMLGDKHTYVAHIYDKIGNAHSNKSENDLALEYHLKSLNLRLELFGEKHISVATTYVNVGSDYGRKKEYDLALECYINALQIVKEFLGETHSYVATIYNNIGVVYANKVEHNLALDYYFRALEIRKELFGENHTQLGESYLNIGASYKDKEEYDLAMQYYLKGLGLFKKLLGEKHFYMASAYENIGAIYFDKEEYDTALQYYQTGIASSLNDFDDTINVYSVPVIKGCLNWDYLLTALYLKAQIFTNHHKDLTGLENLSGFKLALRHYQACDTLINQTRQSISSKSDKLALGEQASKIYKGAVNVCQKLIDSAPSNNVSYYKELAFYFSEKNKSSVLLEALAGVEAQKFAGIPDTLLDKEHKLQIDIALNTKLLAENPNSAEEIFFRDKLFKANRQYDELISIFEGQYPEYFELKYNRKSVDIKEIQKILDNKTAIISYFTGDSTITIFTITKNYLDVKAVPAIENFADTIRNYRYGLIYTGSSRFAKVYKKYAYKMYMQLIPSNLNKKIKNLIIIPDAELSKIPFETLLTENPEDKEWKDLPYLIKKYSISYSYSANLFYKILPKESKNKIEYTDLNDWLAFAPVFDDSNTAGLTMRTRKLLEQFDTELNDTTETRGILNRDGYVSPLPGTESEVQAIFKQFDGKGKKALVQIRKNANEEFIKSVELKKYRLLHFATHGFVSTTKPELSGIFLAQDSTLNEDGILYSGEIYNLKLNADLTVLSACETGLGEIKKGEGLIGLTRALLYAGSKNIIVSLWKVADKSTSDLMIDFYKNLLESEQDFSQALQQAKLKMINERKYSHPFYWSPFILIGK